MHCDVYKFNKKDEMYVYIARPDYPNDINEIKDALAVIPSEIRNTLGLATFVMHIDLSTRQSLARVDINQVLEKLIEQGYFLQFPPDPLAGFKQTEPPAPFKSADC